MSGHFAAGPAELRIKLGVAVSVLRVRCGRRLAHAVRRLRDAGGIAPFAKQLPNVSFVTGLPAALAMNVISPDRPGFDRGCENVGHGDCYPLAGLLGREPDDAVAHMREADANGVSTP